MIDPKQLRLEPGKGKTERARITLSILPNEMKAWTWVARQCGLSVSKWATVNLNRICVGIPPTKPGENGKLTLRVNHSKKAEK